MKRNVNFKLLRVSVTLVLCVACICSSISVNADVYKADHMFLCGATYELPTDDISDTLERDFYRMTSFYGINSVSIYKLDSYSESELEILFAKLKEYNIKMAVRLEAYPDGFCFSSENIDWITNKYLPVLQYISMPGRKEYISYIALNMPVDDTAVQNNLGGLNSQQFISVQPGYAEKLVSAVRNITDTNGFLDAKLYLSVFYGWDNTYLTPSYSDCGADGYFLNNYSYPVNNVVASNQDTDGVLISADKLRVSMDKYKEQYADEPLIIEFGFHTVSFNNGAVCNQIAGLVEDISAKKRAINATISFYRQNYPFVEGYQYFGYNVLKSEGSDNSMLDWQLFYEGDEAELGIPQVDIKNPDFESGMEYWGVTGDSSDDEGIQSENVYSGNNALKIAAGNTGRDVFQSSGWTSEKSRLIGGAVLTAMVLDAELDSGEYKLTAEFKRNNSTVCFYSSPSYSKRRNGWRNLTVNIPESTAGVYDEILFKIELSSGAGFLYVDNFSVKECDSMIFNGGFENGNSNSAAEWGIWPDSTCQDFIDTDVSFEGMRSIGVELNKEQNYSFYSTPVKNGAASEMNCIIYVSYENVTDTEIYFHVNRGDFVAESDRYRLDGSSDGFMMYCFSIPYNSDAQYAQFQIEVGKGSGHIWFDNVILQPVSGIVGDINNDGVTDIRDLVRIKKYLSSDNRCVTAVEDINSDGRYNAQDTVILKKIIIS